MKQAVYFLCLAFVVTSYGSELHWFKGNTHTHSLWSDGDDFPEMIADWYAERGYDFLVLSDHNVLSRGERWYSVARATQKGAMEKYRQRFGDKVEEKDGKVRLKTYEEVRDMFKDRLLLVEGEEITDRFADPNDGFKVRHVHINAMNNAELIKPRGGKSVRDVMRNNLRAAMALEKETGQPILTHLNHPNFHYSVTGEDLGHVVEEPFFEVFNGHPSINQLGNTNHVPVEVMWDQANAIRLREKQAAPLFGVATDDSHNYHGGKSSPGRGWVMVRAGKCSAEDLILAMRAGDFYASSGIQLREISYDADSRVLNIDIEPVDGATFTTEIIALRGKEAPAEVVKEYSGLRVQHSLDDRDLYVRAMIKSDQPHPNPTYKGQVQQAWTQPVGWR